MTTRRANPLLKVATARAYDFILADHGSICVLTPLTDAGRDWAEAHLPEDAQTWGRGIVIEPRYVGPILEGLQADGLDFC